MKTTLFPALTAVAGLVATGCGGGTTTPPPQPPGTYYNLVAGQCAEYAPDGGSAAPSVGVYITASVSPPGIKLKRVRHQTEEETLFVSFDTDGGGVLLNEREYPTAMGAVQEVYSTPLKFLPPPPLTTQTLNSESLCQSGSVCSDLSLDVHVSSSGPYTGPGSDPDAGSTQTQLQFTYTYNPDGGQTLDEWGLVPGVGFTDLYLKGDTGSGFTHYLLVDIITDGGPCAEH